MSWLLPPEMTAHDRWAVVANKEFRVGWKTEKDIARNFTSFERAYKKADELIEDQRKRYPGLYDSYDPPISLVFCFRGTKLAAIDIDLSKELIKKALIEKTFHYDNWRDYVKDDHQRADKIKLVEYCIDNYHTRRSSSGGFHVLVDNSDGLLDEMGSRKNKISEIFTRTLLFVCKRVESNLPIKKPCDKLLGLTLHYESEHQSPAKKKAAPAKKKATSVKKKAAPTEKTSTPVAPNTGTTNVIPLPSCSLITPAADEAISEHDRERVYHELNRYAQVAKYGIPGASLLDAEGGEDGFFQLMKYLTGIIPVDQFVEFCMTQPYRLSSGQTKEQYFANVRNRYESVKPHYSVQSQLAQFFTFVNKRAEQVDKIMEKARSLQGINKKASSSPTPNLDSSTREPSEKPIVFNRAFYDSLDSASVRRPLDVPRGKITAVHGGSGTGKTGLVLSEVLLQLKNDKTVLYISNDMAHNELRPFFYSYGIPENNKFYVFDDEQVITKELLIDTIMTVNPDLLVVDTLDTMLMQCSDDWDFGSWKTTTDAMSFFKELIKKANTSVIGIFHTPEKSSPFEMPHNSKLKGLMYRAFLILDRNSEYIKSWSRQDIVSKWDTKEEGTFVIMTTKCRGTERLGNHFCRFAEETDHNTHKDDWKPLLPTEWELIELPATASRSSKKVSCAIINGKNNKEHLTADKLVAYLKERVGKRTMKHSDLERSLLRRYDKDTILPALKDAQSTGRIIAKEFRSGYFNYRIGTEETNCPIETEENTPP